MELAPSTVLDKTRESWTRSRRHWYIAVFFVLVWPTFNLLVVSLVLRQLGILSSTPLSVVAVPLFSAFALAYVVISIAERLFPRVLAQDNFWPQLALHMVTLPLCGRIFGPVLAQTAAAELPPLLVIPLAYMLVQIALFVAAKTFLIQREIHYRTQLTLRQAQINALRSQSNPHFLFNTLNLLAAEIPRNPENAREIVYDLADLLRESLQAADREFVPLEEEIRLVKLYLGLQQKRFSDRLSYDIELDADCGGIQIPSLLLQPIVENAVKHVVANSSRETRIEVRASVGRDLLCVTVRDNGPKLEPDRLREGGGLRIVRETLALHYPGRGEMIFDSTEAGSVVTLSLPVDGPGKHRLE